MPFINPHPASPTLGDELNPSPSATLQVGQRPGDKVFLDCTGDFGVLLTPGVSFFLVDRSIGTGFTVCDEDDAPLDPSVVIPHGLSGAPVLRFEVACDDGVCTLLSIKQVLAAS